jgi:hypothetical protein
VATALTVIFAGDENTTGHPEPPCTTALNHVSEVRFPIATADSVLVALDMSAGFVNSASVDFCHFVITPECPFKIRPEGGCVLKHIVWFEVTVPPDAAGLTVILAGDEYATSQPAPFCTTALNQVSEISGPIEAVDSIFVMFGISSGFVNVTLFDFCHFMTVPD